MGINLYDYVGNNPLRFRDPMGLYPYNAAENAQAQADSVYDDSSGSVFGDTTLNQSPGPVDLPPLTADMMVNVAAILSLAIAPELSPEVKYLVTLYLAVAKACASGSSASSSK